VWRVEGSHRYALPCLDFFTTIRGVGLWGLDFDAMEPVDTLAGAEQLPLESAARRADRGRPG
jgi:hypothetical protein